MSECVCVCVCMRVKVKEETHHFVEPLLVALHAVARVHHDELAGVVHAALVATDLALLTQHPVLKQHKSR